MSFSKYISRIEPIEASKESLRIQEDTLKTLKGIHLAIEHNTKEALKDPFGQNIVEQLYKISEQLKPADLTDIEVSLHNILSELSTQQPADLTPLTDELNEILEAVNKARGTDYQQIPQLSPFEIVPTNISNFRRVVKLVSDELEQSKRTVTTPAQRRVVSSVNRDLTKTSIKKPLKTPTPDPKRDLTTGPHSLLKEIKELANAPFGPFVMAFREIKQVLSSLRGKPTDRYADNNSRRQKELEESRQAAIEQLKKESEEVIKATENKPESLTNVSTTTQDKTLKKQTEVLTSIKADTAKLTKSQPEEDSESDKDSEEQLTTSEEFTEATEAITKELKKSNEDRLSHIATTLLILAALGTLTYTFRKELKEFGTTYLKNLPNTLILGLKKALVSIGLGKNVEDEETGIATPVTVLDRFNNFMSGIDVDNATSKIYQDIVEKDPETSSGEILRKKIQDESAIAPELQTGAFANSYSNTDDLLLEDGTWTTRERVPSTTKGIVGRASENVGFSITKPKTWGKVGQVIKDMNRQVESGGAFAKKGSDRKGSVTDSERALIFGDLADNIQNEINLRIKDGSIDLKDFTEALTTGSKGQFDKSLLDEILKSFQEGSIDLNHFNAWLVDRSRSTRPFFIEGDDRIHFRAPGPLKSTEVVKLTRAYRDINADFLERPTTSNKAKASQIATQTGLPDLTKLPKEERNDAYFNVISSNYQAMSKEEVHSAAGSQLNKKQANLSKEQIETAKEIFSFWKSKGYTDPEAQALTSIAWAESRFDSKAVNSSTKAHGIYQVLGSRKKDYDKFLKGVRKTNPNISDLQAQLEFAYHEHKTSEKRNVSKAGVGQGLTNPAEIAAGYQSHVQRSLYTVDEHGIDQRQLFAVSKVNELANLSQHIDGWDPTVHKDLSSGTLFNLTQQSFIKSGGKVPTYSARDHLATQDWTNKTFVNTWRSNYTSQERQDALDRNPNVPAKYRAQEEEFIRMEKATPSASISPEQISKHIPSISPEQISKHTTASVTSNQPTTPDLPQEETKVITPEVLLSPTNNISSNSSYTHTIKQPHQPSLFGGNSSANG